MAVSFRSASGAQNATAASTFSVAQPAGAAAGDLVLVQIQVGANTSFNTAAGWTLDHNLQNGATTSPFTTGIYYRILTGTESWPVSFTTAAAGRYAWTAAAFTPGAGQLIYVDTQAAVKDDTTSATTHTANAVTALSSNVCSVILNGGRRQASSATGATVTAPANWTEPANGDQTTASGTGTANAQIAAEVCYRISQSGTVTPAAATWSVAVSATVAHYLLGAAAPATNPPPLAQPPGPRVLWLRRGYAQASMPPATIAATAAPVSAGSVTAAAIQQTPAPLGAAGSLAVAAVQIAPAAIAGTASAAAGAGQQVTIAMTGAGSLGGAVTQQITAGTAGTGAIAAAATQQAADLITGTGSLSAAAVQGGAAAVAGTGSLSAAASGTTAATGPPLSSSLGQAAGVRATWARTGHVQTSLPSTQTVLAATAITGTSSLAAEATGTITPGPLLLTPGQPAGPRVSWLRTGNVQASAVTGVLLIKGEAAIAGGGTVTLSAAGGTGPPLSSSAGQPAGIRLIPLRAGHMQFSEVAPRSTGTPLPALAQPPGPRVLWLRRGYAQATAIPGVRTFQVLASLAGGGNVAPAVTQQATVAIAGSGTAVVAPVMPGTTAISGSGALAVAAVQVTSAAVAATGGASASSSTPGTAPLGASGSLAVAAVQIAPAAIAGTASAAAIAALTGERLIGSLNTQTSSSLNTSSTQATGTITTETQH